MWKRLTTAITTTLVWGVRGYRLAVSPHLPPSCRFTPTCSKYAIEALERKGLFVGTCLAIRRLLRCHPFHPGGYDPVERPASQDGPEGAVCLDGSVSSASPDGSGRTRGPGVPAGHSVPRRANVPGGAGGPLDPSRTGGAGGPLDQPHATA